jgi:hypothetical protein
MRFWWRKPDGKRLLVRRRHRWENNIKTDFQEILLTVDWIDLAQDRGKWYDAVNAVMNFQVP